MIKQQISVHDILGFHTGDDMPIELGPQELFGVMDASIDRTFRNLPNNMKLNNKNKEIVKKLLRTELIYQAMLFNDPNLGDPQ